MTTSENSASCAPAISEEIAAAIHLEMTGQKWATTVANSEAGNAHFNANVRRYRRIAAAALRGARAWFQAADLAPRLGSARTILEAMEANAASRGDVILAAQCGRAVQVVAEAKALVAEFDK